MFYLKKYQINIFLMFFNGFNILILKIKKKYFNIFSEENIKIPSTHFYFSKKL